MLTCIIIDDNELAINTLKVLLLNFCPNVKVIGTSQSIVAGVNLINETKPDLVFLDIEIKNELGFDIFSFFPNPSFSIIFTTAHEKYAFQAIKSRCFDYLLKPIDPTELVKAITNFEQKKASIKIDNLSESKTSKLIAFLIKNGYEFIDEKDIMYLKADGKYTDIVLKNNKTHKSSKSLGEIEPSLSNVFFKCHKAYIVNINYISKFMKDDFRIILSDSTEIDIAARRKDDFLKLFNRF